MNHRRSLILIIKGFLFFEHCLTTWTIKYMMNVVGQEGLLKGYTKVNKIKFLLTRVEGKPPGGGKYVR